MKNIYKFLIFSFLLCFSIGCKEKKKPNSNLKLYKGEVFGTTFGIKYYSENSFENSIDSIFKKFNQSLSTYDENSLISKFNESDLGVIIDETFEKVVLKSKEIHKETKGYFDPTIGILIKAYGFYSKEKTILTKEDKDSLMNFVGFDKLDIRGPKLIKSHPLIRLDFNAIAKGYALDIVGEFLESKKINNYLIEIGGEVRAKGQKENGKCWKVGIEKPLISNKREIFEKICLDNESMATSGNYRKNILDSLTGKRYTHILNPLTGESTESNLLSVSVVGKNCLTADAYATAIMSMGFEKAKDFAKTHKELKVYLIFQEKNKSLEIWKNSN